MRLSLHLAVTNCPQNGYSTNIEPQGASDESGAPASSNTPGSLDPQGHPPRTASHYSFNRELDEAVNQLDHGQLTATPIAPVDSQPYNYIGRHSPAPPRNIRDGYTSLDHVIDTLLELSNDYQQSEAQTQAQVDEFVRQNYGMPEPAVHQHNVGAHSTPDAGLDHGMATFGPSRQPDSTSTDLGAPLDIGDQTAAHFYLVDSSQEVEYPETPEPLRERNAFNTPPQVYVTPARPPRPRYPYGQPEFGQTTYGYAHTNTEYGHRAVNHVGYFDRQYSASIGLGDRATGQGYGGQNDDEYFMASQDQREMPPPSRLRRRRGPLPSYETWRSFVNQDIGLR